MKRAGASDVIACCLFEFNLKRRFVLSLCVILMSFLTGFQPSDN